MFLNAQNGEIKIHVTLITIVVALLRKIGKVIEGHWLMSMLTS